MPIHNSDIADIFNKVADLLEIQGANPFRVRAYRDAARTIGGLSKSVADMISQEKDLSGLPGIGQDLAGKIKTIIKEGSLPLLEDLKKKIPAELSDLMSIESLGPKRIHALYTNLNITSFKELQKAAEEGKVRSLSGFGEKTEQKILEEIKRLKGEAIGRALLVEAEQIVSPYIEYLKKDKSLKDIAVAGSFRRRRETVGDLDILSTSKENSSLMDLFVNYEDVKKILSKGDTRSSVILRRGIQVDLRVVPEKSYGAALLYFTGSKAHNIAVRKIGQKKNLKINEYGVFKGKKSIAGKTEEDVYKKIGLPYIEPELRENRGEIEAAQKKNLPQLVTLKDIKGDLHVHTRATDGRYTLEQMAEAAEERDYSYMAITDHSKKVSVANGLDEKRLAQQIKEIDKLNEKIKNFTLLKSIEVDILEDGSLDLPDDILSRLDLVVCSIHYKFNLPREKQTERIIRALDNPHVNILAHPTGRMLNQREPYQVDMEKVMEAAKERGCFLELNAYPDRLDLDDAYCKLAKEIGLKVAVSTDAHSINDLEFMRFGIGQARRGWLEPSDIINTRGLDELRRLLKKR
ncbi:MAG: DNA polymerase/3'-5' exonuclease PolX [Acidobacteriota bacterium]